MKKIQKGVAALLLLTMPCGLAACGTAAAAQVVPDKVSSTSEVASSSVGQTYVYMEQHDLPPKQVSYQEYETFGLKYDESKNELYFDGELVRYFYDGVDVADGVQSVYCEFLNENGTVDIHTTRETIKNADGSVNPFGRLTGIERYSQEEFDNRDLSSFYDAPGGAVYVSGFYDPTAESFADRFDKYKEFGIEYVESENASGTGNIYYNGKLVKYFLDLSPSGDVFTFQSTDGGSINVQTIYENDKIVGVKEME